MSKAKQFLDKFNDQAASNSYKLNRSQDKLWRGTYSDPDFIAGVAAETDQAPVNREGIEDDISLLQRLLGKSGKIGSDSHIQGMANVGIIKMGLG